MPEINLFNAGMNRFKHPRKLENNECKSIINADVSSGSVRSVSKPIKIGSGVSQRFIEYKDRIVSGNGAYLKFEKAQQYLFRSDGTIPQYTIGSRDSNDNLAWIPMGVETTPIGITLSTLTASFDVIVTDKKGASEVGIYTYMIVADEERIYKFDYECPTASRELTIKPSTTTGVSYTQGLKVYRKYKGGYYLVADSINDTTDFVIDPDHVKTPDYDETLTYIFPGHVSYAVTYSEGFYTGVQIITDGYGRGRVYYIDNAGQESGEDDNRSSFADRDSDKYFFEVNFKSGTAPDKGDKFRWLNYPDKGFVDGPFVYMLGKEEVNGLWEFEFWLAYDYGSSQAWNAVKVRIGFNSIKVVEVATDLSDTPKALDVGRIFAPPEDSLVIREAYDRVFTVETTGDGDIADGSSATMDLETRMDSDFKGSFQYAVTYEDSLGAETEVADYSYVIDSEGNSIQVNIAPTVGVDPALKYINIYRLNNDIYGGQTQFLFVKRLNIATELPHTFIDTYKIEDLGKLLPPATITQVAQDMLYFTTYKGRLFGATKDYNYTDTAYAPTGGNEYPPEPWAYGKIWTSSNRYTFTAGTLAGETIASGEHILYKDGQWVLIDRITNDYTDYKTLRWSDTGKPLTWQTNSWLNMDEYITGVGTTANGLIIFSRTSTYALLGTEAEPFTLRLLSNSHGCVDHRSIQHWKGNCIYASVEGVCVTNGGTVDLLSYPKMGIMLMDQPNRPTDIIWWTTVKSSAVVGNTYFLLYKDGTILKIDLDTMVITQIQHTPVMKGLANVKGKLYGASLDTDLYEISYRSEYTGFTAENYWWSYVSGFKTEGMIANLKEYDKVRVSLTGEGTIYIRIDKDMVIKGYTLKDGVTEIGIPNERNKGYGIEFAVSGRGSLHSIEYSVKGRENV